ncbi:MAG: glycosyltransferase family 39 protein [Bacteroidetes bacterium]|nr:glycosyltransferase family 39 protein [Bacteroidota bacterium]
MLLKLEQFNGFAKKNNRIIVFLFFALFFIIGIGIYKDYGMSWDEYAQWHDNGYANYNYIFHNDKAALLNGIDKYHGPAFELVLIGIEKIFRLTDSRELFFMRHLVIFITFFISSVFFFLTAKKVFNNRNLALVGALFYILCPHIFAHSFYNSKDAVFLAFFTINIFVLICFHEKQTYLRALIYAVITAFTIDIRIIGIIIPAISLFLFLIELAVSLKEKKKIGSKVSVFSIYFILLFPFIVLFWPVLWMDPIFHFIEALKENSAYGWNGEVLYFGKAGAASDLPRHYILFWIFISKPVIYSVLFVVGVITLFISFIKRPLLFITTRTKEMVFLLWFFIPLGLIFILRSIVFDTGRHLYFMNGGFILIVLYGLQQTINVLKYSAKILFSFYVILFLSLISVVYTMIKIHPYQREVLENILAKDPSKHIKIYAENFPEKLNVRILTPEQRGRITFTETAEEANYFIVDYRWHREGEYTYRKEIYSALIGNAKIITAFKVRQPEEIAEVSKGKLLKSYFTNFDSLQVCWDNNMIVQPNCTAHSGLFAAKVDSATEYSSGLTVKDLKFLVNRKNVLLKASYWRYNDAGPVETKLVVTIAHADGTSYFWNSINETVSKNTEYMKGWKEVVGILDIPPVKSQQDILKVYLWDIGKNRIFIDDIRIDFIEEKEIKN